MAVAGSVCQILQTFLEAGLGDWLLHFHLVLNSSLGYLEFTWAPTAMLSLIIALNSRGVLAPLGLVLGLWLTARHSWHANVAICVGCVHDGGAISHELSAIGVGACETVVSLVVLGLALL